MITSFYFIALVGTRWSFGQDIMKHRLFDWSLITSFLQTPFDPLKGKRHEKYWDSLCSNANKNLSTLIERLPAFYIRNINTFLTTTVPKRTQNCTHVVFWYGYFVFIQPFCLCLSLCETVTSLSHYNISLGLWLKETPILKMEKANAVRWN